MHEFVWNRSLKLDYDCFNFYWQGSILWKHASILGFLTDNYGDVQCSYLGHAIIKRQVRPRQSVPWSSSCELHSREVTKWVSHINLEWCLQFSRLHLPAWVCGAWRSWASSTWHTKSWETAAAPPRSVTPMLHMLCYVSSHAVPSLLHWKFHCFSTFKGLLHKIFFWHICSVFLKKKTSTTAAGGNISWHLTR